MVMAVWLFLLLSIIIKPQHCSYLFTAPSDRWWCMARLTYCDLLIYGRQCLGREGFSRTNIFSFVTNSILISLKKPSEMEVAPRYALLKLLTLITLFNTVFTVYNSSWNSIYKFYSSPPWRKVQNCSWQKWHMIQRRNTINTDIFGKTIIWIEW